jgi:hypothetical protein
MRYGLFNAGNPSCLVGNNPEAMVCTACGLDLRFASLVNMSTGQQAS